MKQTNDSAGVFSGAVFLSIWGKQFLFMHQRRVILSAGVAEVEESTHYQYCVAEISCEDPSMRFAYSG